MKLALILTTFIACVVQTQAKPLKVFILAGQSNMEGPANISTFDYIGDDPATAPLLKMMRGADGKPTVCDDVWISYLTGAGDNNFTLNGKLTSGYGSLWGQDPTKPGTNIGPEFKGTVLAVETAPFWDKTLGEIDAKHGKVSQMAWILSSKNKGGPNEDGKMTQEQQEAYLKEFRAKLITPEDEAVWKRGASNAGYHYLGCAKTFALMGKGFAEANLAMMKQQKRP